MSMRLRKVSLLSAVIACGFTVMFLLTARADGPIDFQALDDIGDLVDVTYSRATFNRRTGELRTNVVIKNTSVQDIRCPIAFVISSIFTSFDPDAVVTVVNADGTTGGGDPFFDLSSKVGADNLLSPGESSAPTLIRFHNPTRGRFDFAAECLGVQLSANLAITIDSPANQLITTLSAVDVSGTTEAAQTVAVNGIPATISGDTSFSASGVPLLEGTNVIVATAEDRDGNSVSASITVRRDTSPPLVVIESPRNGDRLIATSVPVAGTVNDIIPGATINDDDVSVKVNGQSATVNNRTFFLPNLPLVLGTNTISVQAIDRAGNTIESSIQVTRETDLAGVRILITGGNVQTSVIKSLLAEPLAVHVVGPGGSSEVNRPVTFEVSRGDGVLGDFQLGKRSIILLTDGAGNAQIPFTIGSRTGEGFHRVKVTTPGSLATAEFCATGTTTPSANIAAVMLPPSQCQVGQPLPDPVSVIVTDQGGNPVAGVAVTFQVEAGGGQINGQDSVTAVTNPDGIAEAIWTVGLVAGVSNNQCSATFDGNPGQPVTLLCSGVKAGPVSSTTVSGVVQNSAGQPIPGVKAVLRGTSLQAFSGADGKFVIPNVVPGGHHVGVLGSAANNEINSIFYPDIDFAIRAIAGVENKLDQIVILPFLDSESARMVGGDEDVTLTMKGVPGFSITVLAHSTFQRDPITQQLVQQPLMMSSSQVKNDKVPMAPPQGSTPLIVGTLQPGGILLNPPARVCYPNVEGLTPGDVADVFAFHHDIGQFVNIGPGTVTEDGSQVCSDPGFGIVQSGWHCLIRLPGPTSNCTNGCTANWMWTADGGMGSNTTVVVCNSDDPVATPKQATVTVSNFGPAGGSIDPGSSWSISDTSVIDFVGGTSSSLTIQIKALKSGTAKLISPTYKVPQQDQADIECQVEIPVEVVKLEVENVHEGSVLDPMTLATTEKVGVQTKLKAKVTATSTSLTGLTYKWTVGGQNIKTYEHDIDEDAKHMQIPLATADLAKEDIAFFWRNEGGPSAATASAPHEVMLEVEKSGVFKCKTTVKFDVTQTADPNVDVYTKDADMRRTPNGEADTYEVLNSHENWHTFQAMANGDTPVGSAPEGTWGDRPGFALTYNGSAFLDWHKEFIDAHLAWRNTFNVGPIGGAPPGAPTKPTYLEPVPPPTSTQQSRVYGYVRLGEFQTLDELGRDVVSPWHNSGHGLIAAANAEPRMGGFASPGSKSNLFWRWHTRVDGPRADFGTDQASAISVVPAENANVAIPTEIIVVFDKKVSSQDGVVANALKIGAAKLTVGGNPASTMVDDGGSTSRFMRYKFTGFAAPTPDANREIEIVLTGTASYQSKTWKIKVP